MPSHRSTTCRNFINFILSTLLFYHLFGIHHIQEVRLNCLHISTLPLKDIDEGVLVGLLIELSSVHCHFQRLTDVFATFITCLAQGNRDSASVLHDNHTRQVFGYHWKHLTRGNWCCKQSHCCQMAIGEWKAGSKSLRSWLSGLLDKAHCCKCMLHSDQQMPGSPGSISSFPTGFRLVWINAEDLENIISVCVMTAVTQQKQSLKTSL